MIKVILDSYHKIVIERFVIIKFLQKAKELGKVVCIIKVGIHHLKVLQDFNEVTHYIRKNGNPEDQNDDTD